MEKDDDILYMVKDEIAWITINQADKMNRLTFEGMLTLVKTIEKAGNDDGVKVLVITGAGDKAFALERVLISFIRSLF